MSGSVILKRVVRRLQGQGCVHLKKRLPDGIGDLDTPHIHLRNPFFRCDEGSGEFRVLHQLLPRSFWFVGGLHSSGRLTSQAEREGGFGVRRRGVPVVSHPRSQSVRSTDVKMSWALRQNVHPARRHARGDFRNSCRRRRHQLLHEVGQRIDVLLEGRIHAASLRGSRI